MFDPEKKGQVYLRYSFSRAEKNITTPFRSFTKADISFEPRCREKRTSRDRHIFVRRKYFGCLRFLYQDISMGILYLV
jgi:hypothetical protein